MGLPADLQQILDDIDDADRAGEAIAASCTDEQFYWQPRGGEGWSIAQCLDHLATTNVVYGDAVRTGVDSARARGWKRRGPATPGFFGALFVNYLEPPAKHRSRAPRKIRPAPQKSRSEILDAYHAAHQNIRRLIADAAEIDANRARFRNPFIGLARVRVSTGLRVITAHDRRHLWQAEQVRKTAGYPGTPPGLKG